MTNPILIHPEPNKKYYLITDSSKHSWSGILVQYSEQTKDDVTKIKKNTPITYCCVGQYGSMSTKSHRCIYILVVLSRGKYTAFIVCTAIHNCSSSGSLFFASLRWNN